MTETCKSHPCYFQGFNNEKWDKQQRQRFVGSKLLDFTARQCDHRHAPLASFFIIAGMFLNPICIVRIQSSFRDIIRFRVGTPMSWAATKANKKAVAHETADQGRLGIAACGHSKKQQSATKCARGLSSRQGRRSRLSRGDRFSLCVIGSEGEQYCSLLAPQSIRQAQVGAARTMIERTGERFGLEPERLAADTGYGAAMFSRLR